MNDHAPLTGPATSPAGEPRLQTLDLGALGIGDTSGQLLACDIDDPDCEPPEVASPTPGTETDTNEV